MGSGGVKIEARCLQAIDLGVQGRFEAGMNLILPAIEATAKRSLGKTRVGRTDFKNFLGQYIWLLEAFGLPGINLIESRFATIADMDEGKPLVDPTFADLIYHVFRCSYAHGQDISDCYSFHPTAPGTAAHASIGVDGSTLFLPESVFWSLIACVVFSKANSDIRTVSEYYLTWDASIPLGKPTAYRFDLDMFWGGEETVKAFFEKMKIPRVQIDFRTSVANEG